MTYALPSFVGQLKLRFVASHDERSASAIVASPHCTIVSALAAVRRLALVVAWALWLAVATDLDVVPSVMPKPDIELAVNPAAVLPSVQRISAFGAIPRPCATVCGAAILTLTPAAVQTVVVADAVHVRATLAAPAAVVPPPF